MNIKSGTSLRCMNMNVEASKSGWACHDIGCPSLVKIGAFLAGNIRWILL